MDTPYTLIGKHEDADYEQKLEAEAKKKEKGIYPRTIFIAIGGTGAKALILLRRMILERFGTVDALEGVSFLSIDTDVSSQEASAEEQRNPLEQQLRFEKDERVNVQLDFKNYVGPNIIHHPQIREWWDEAALPSETFNIEKGAGQVRPLARLAFFTNKDAIEEGIGRAYRKVVSQRIKSGRVETGSSVRVVVVAGLAGGTGSGMLLDLAALIHEQLGHHEQPILEGFFVLPGGFSTVEQDQNYPKIAANGYAALRELNHYLTHPFEVRWSRSAAPVVVRGLYDRYVLFSGTNAYGEHLDNLGDCYLSIAETLFLDFGAGPMAGWVQGVRVNRADYLRSAVTYTYRLAKADGTIEETHADQWRNAFSSVGISKLVFPTWRLINQAKYELAAQMVGLMDLGRRGGLSDVITRHRNRFMFDCGFFQGERDGERGRQTFWQIRDRLARQSGVGQVANIYDHIRKYQQELVDLAESMYTEKNTGEAAGEIWSKISGLWGDPASPGSEGDWVRNIHENRLKLIKEVEAELPRVVEDFRRKPAVGISGLVDILKDILDQFDRPADQAVYSDWFKQTRMRLSNEISEQLKLWRKRVKIAEDASRGFGSTVDTHHEAVRRASEAFCDHWRARVNDYICLEGEKALEGIRVLVRDQLRRLEQIAEKMLALEAEYRSFAEFYSKPQKSFIVHEIPVSSDIGDLLAPYLGKQPEERDRRLLRLLDQGLRKMGLDTLEAIAGKLFGEFQSFRNNLAAQAFYALRGEGEEVRLTAAFADNPDEAVPGFIERYSVFGILKETYSETERREMYDQLYKKGLPWGQENRTESLLNLHKPHGDAFVGFVESGQRDIATELVDHLRANSEARFSPHVVRAYDPSEIIFYTELTAYPVYYLSEISSLKKHYESILNDTSTNRPLHIHQDYHQFQPIVPYAPGQLASYQNAWRLFIQAQMLGIISSLRLRPNDDTRVAFQWRRRVGPFEVQWTDLGPEGQLIRRMMADYGGVVKPLRDAIDDAKKRLLASRDGAMVFLAALADYYYYCIFPVRGVPGIGRQAMTPVGSMQNRVCSDLRTEWWRELPATRADLGTNLRNILGQLSRWSKPIYRDPSQIVPQTTAVPPEERLEEWDLLGNVQEAVRQFISEGLLKPSSDAQGNPLFNFPRLSINWDYFAPSPPVEPEPGVGSTWYYRGQKGHLVGLTARDVAAHVAENPGGRHRVWTHGMRDWQDALDIPEIRECVRTPPPEADGPPIDTLVEETPPEDVPPPLEPAAGTLLHYARDGQQLGKLSLAQIAIEIANHPDSDHKVWTKSFGQWKPALDLPEIVDLLDDEPPPLPEDE